MRTLSETKTEIRLPKDLKDSLQVIADKNCKKMSEVMREAMVLYIKSHHNSI